ncbi:hypothetical protein VIGAN_10136000 [Vigna angularis var. angularis]|uniref:Uncharacterized protein n=1 Tax=Vigna angularis var. angularis TaxID=157739 RepID=A0A0S3T3M4_PHAAN|nr:hypothetical protein VIGAN_10136000 [Vigna angularis var. angularis]
MDFTAEKKESENNNANNPENAHQTLDASSQLASTLDSSNKETKEQQSHELKAGLYPLKIAKELGFDKENLGSFT